MRIGIDARPLSYRLTGIGFYLKYLLDEIQRIDIENRYFLISNAPIHYHIKIPRWARIEGRCKKKAVEHALDANSWSQQLKEKGLSQFSLYYLDLVVPLL